jgi:hypothetical protein
MTQSPTPLDLAKESFLSLLGELPGDAERKCLLQWIKDDLIGGLPQDLESRLALEVKYFQMCGKIKVLRPQ